MSIDTISCVIIAKDAQVTIEETLSSLKLFSEVILYLNNSTDETKNIAARYDNVKIIDGEFTGFGDTKNKAASFSKNSWVLSLDSDEVLSDRLVQEISSLELDDEKKVFVLKRDNYFLGKHIKHSGWGKDFLVRIYNKSYHNFNSNIVHEYIELKDDVKKINLKNSFKHNAVLDINQFLNKAISYSDLASKDAKTCSYLIVILKSQYAFFKTFFLQLGFLDGWRGYVIAVSSYNGKFFRYTKRYINCRQK